MIASAVEGIDLLKLDVLLLSIEGRKDRFPIEIIEEADTCPHLFPSKRSTCFNNQLWLI